MQILCVASWFQAKSNISLVLFQSKGMVVEEIIARMYKK